MVSLSARDRYSTFFKLPPEIFVETVIPQIDDSKEFVKSEKSEMSKFGRTKKKVIYGTLYTSKNISRVLNCLPLKYSIRSDVLIEKKNLKTCTKDNGKAFARNQ